MSDFLKIISTENGPVQYELVRSWFGANSMKMTNHKFPYSITETEFEFLKDLIIMYNLKSGYEIATAFGVSSTGIGLGFKETGGKLVTMDAYIEENANNCESYKDYKPAVYENMDGYKSAKFLIKEFGLEDTVFLEVGWSPNDTESVIRKHISEPLDFVFIDGGHFPNQLINDISSVVPLLADKYVIAFHDMYPGVFDESVNEHIRKTFGKDVQVAVPEPYGYNLSIIMNI
jgi:predicted O-methyltransferase YrrM